MAPPNCPVSDLREYLAVPGKMIKIPGTDYVLITPLSEEAASCAAPAPPLSAQIRRRGRPVGKSTPCQCPNCQVGQCFPHTVSLSLCVTVCHYVTMSLCHYCVIYLFVFQEDPKSDRHICHVENCGKVKVDN